MRLLPPVKILNKNIGVYIFLIIFFNEIIMFSEKVNDLLIGEGMAVLSILPNIMYRGVINVYITRFSRFAEIGFN